MDLAISLLNYNTKNLVKQCVKNIVDSQPELEYKIIIVDNNSTDGSVDFIKKEIIPFSPRVKLIISKKNLGFGGGHNLALKNIQAKYILIINPDITVLENAVSKLFNFMEEDAIRGIVGPKLIYPDLSVQSSCHPWPKLLTPFYRRTPLGKTIWGTKELKRYDMLGYDHFNAKKVDWLVGACLMIRTDVWKKINGFDERYFLYYEDIDLCRQCWKADKEIWYYPEAKMIHYHKRLSAEKKWWAAIFDKSTRIHLKSHLKYFKKNVFISKENRY